MARKGPEMSRSSCRSPLSLPEIGETDMTNRTRTAMALLLLAQGLAGCGASPSAPSPVPQSASVAVPQPGPVAPEPVVTSVSPNTGSTGGDSWITITGTGFQRGATVTLDGIPQPAGFDHRYPTTLYLKTLAHAAGTVDVVVTNLGGQPGRLTAGYTYASPQSFDFNGNWLGMDDGVDGFRGMGFTIQNNLLVSVSCDSSTLALSPPPSIVNGEFSFLGNQGVRISGRIVSASEASGTINMAPCAVTIWRAWRG